jgi:hypothetical protein
MFSGGPAPIYRSCPSALFLISISCSHSRFDGMGSHKTTLASSLMSEPPYSPSRLDTAHVVILEDVMLVKATMLRIGAHNREETLARSVAFI